MLKLLITMNSTMLLDVAIKNWKCVNNFDLISMFRELASRLDGEEACRGCGDGELEGMAMTDNR